MTIHESSIKPELSERMHSGSGIDPSSVLGGLDMAPKDVLIGGPESCFTVTGLKVESTRDALLVFEACRQGVLPRITRRLNEAEKQLIGDGTVIVFDEREAGMKRWTDGKLWTPSRILGNFLTYRELDKKLPPNQHGMAEISRWTTAVTDAGSSEYGLNIGVTGDMPESACGTNKGVLFIKSNGLIKRTISLTVPDNEAEFLSRSEWRPLKAHHQHLIVYFRAETAALLPRPEDMEELEALRLPLKILQIQKFRRPVRVEMFEDGSYDFHDSEETEAAFDEPRVAGDGSSQYQAIGSTMAPRQQPPQPQQSMSLAYSFQLAALVASDARGYYHPSPPTPLALQPPVSTGHQQTIATEQREHPILANNGDSLGRDVSYANSSSTSIAMYSSYDLATLPASLPFAESHYASELFDTPSFSLTPQLVEPLGAVSCHLDNSDGSDDNASSDEDDVRVTGSEH